MQEPFNVPLSNTLKICHCKPPFHPDGLIPMKFVTPSFHAVEPVTLTFEQRFLYRRRLRQAWHHQFDLDTIAISARTQLVIYRLCN